MGTPFIGGEPAIKILDVDGVTVLKTVYLPAPNEGDGALLSFPKKSVMHELVDGSQRERVLGHLPNLKLKWKVYDDVTATSKTKGPLNGNRARLQDLLALLASAPGAVVISPGPAPFGATAVSGHGFGVGNGATTTFQLQQAAGKVKLNALGESWPVPTTPRTNYCLQSKALATTPWNPISGGTGTAPSPTNAAGIAPDGTLTASRVVANRGAGNSGADYSIQRGTTALSGNGVDPVVGSIYLRSNTGATQLVYLGINGTGQAVTVTTAWQRFNYTRPALASATYLLDIGTYGAYPTTANSIDVLAWQGQLEVGTVPTSPEGMGTTTAAVTVTPAYWPATTDGFEPCYGFSGTPAIYRRDWQGNQLLYVTARTNLLAYSEQLDNAAWTKVASTAQVNFNTAPDGTVTAENIKEDGANNSHGCYQLVSNTSTGAVTVSIFAKAATRTKLKWGLTTQAETSMAYATFDLAAGTITTPAAITGTAILSSPSATITPVGNGWYRLTVTATANGTQTSLGQYARMVDGSGNTTYVGDNTSGMPVWGAQMEAGSVATAYIPTTTAAVTVTDYTLTATGAVTFATAPLTGAVLTWSGSFQEVRRGFRAFVKMPEPRMLGAGIGGDVAIEFMARDIHAKPELGVF